MSSVLRRLEKLEGACSINTLKHEGREHSAGQEEPARASAGAELELARGQS